LAEYELEEPAWCEVEMVQAMKNSGVLEKDQVWVDCGCGAGVILCFLMLYHSQESQKNLPFIGYGYDMVQRQVDQATSLLTICKMMLCPRSKVITTNVVKSEFPGDFGIIDRNFFPLSSDKKNIKKKNITLFVNNHSWDFKSFRKEFVEKMLGFPSAGNNYKFANVSVLILDPGMLESSVDLQLLCEFKEIATFNKKSSSRMASVFLFCSHRHTQDELCDKITQHLRKEWDSSTKVSFVQSFFV
jgi:hypothetical protein